MELYEHQNRCWNKNVNKNFKYNYFIGSNKNMNKFEIFAVNFSNLITMFVFESINHL